jgi:ATP-dependent RNA helicase DDX3X
VGNNPDTFSEITLDKKDTTLEKVINFFVDIGTPQDSDTVVQEKKSQAILDIWESMADTNSGQTVIFVNTKRGAQALADFLRAHDKDVGQIHGDMDKQERQRVFSEFTDGQRLALVATNVLSRGIDNSNVTLVINVDLPTKMGDSHDSR